MSGDRRARALAILTEVDRALEGWTCEASTDCCRFQITGREPWLTAAEWELVVAEVKRQGKKMPAQPDDADGRCPFLGSDARCTVYAARPLGCRTFYCERAHGPRALDKRAFREAARDLAALPPPPDAARTDEGARPITSWLATATARTPRAGRSRRR